MVVAVRLTADRQGALAVIAGREEVALFDQEAADQAEHERHLGAVVAVRLAPQCQGFVVITAGGTEITAEGMDQPDVQQEQRRSGAHVARSPPIHPEGLFIMRHRLVVPVQVEPQEVGEGMMVGARDDVVRPVRFQANRHATLVVIQGRLIIASLPVELAQSLVRLGEQGVIIAIPQCLEADRQGFLVSRTRPREVAGVAQNPTKFAERSGRVQVVVAQGAAPDGDRFVEQIAGLVVAPLLAPRPPRSIRAATVSGCSPPSRVRRISRHFSRRGRAAAWSSIDSSTSARLSRASAVMMSVGPRVASMIFSARSNAARAAGASWRFIAIVPTWKSVSAVRGCSSP